MEMVPLVANRFLEMMSETVGRLAAPRAARDRRGRAARSCRAEHPDRAFYEGKRFGAQYFAQRAAGRGGKAQLIAREDRTALDIPDAAFAPG